MSDVISEFIDAVVGDDSEVRQELEAARLRLEAGREIHLLRQELNLSVDDFADALGIDREEVERLEIGNFEESGTQKLIEVNRKVRSWLEEADKPEQTTTAGYAPDSFYGKTRPNHNKRSTTA